MEKLFVYLNSVSCLTLANPYHKSLCQHNHWLCFTDYHSACLSFSSSATWPHSFHELLPAFLIRWGQKALSTVGETVSAILAGWEGEELLQAIFKSLFSWESLEATFNLVYKLIPCLLVQSTRSLQYWLCCGVDQLFPPAFQFKH